MIPRDYYPLDEAAGILNCSERDLIHEGARGRLDIYVLTAGYFVNVDVLSNGDLETNRGYSDAKYLKLWAGCLQELESVGANAAVFIKPDEMTSIDGEYIRFCYSLRHKNQHYPSIDLITELQKQGVNIDDIYPAPVLLKDCTLVVLRGDIERLQSAKTPRKIPIDVKRDEAFRQWIDETSNYAEMSWAEIETALIKKNRTLFSSGFDRWSRNQQIYKRRGGLLDG